MRDSLRHVEGVRSDLEAMGVPARPLDGREVLDLLHGRFDPDAQRAGGLPASFMCPEVIASPVAGRGRRGRERSRAGALREAICTRRAGSGRAQPPAGSASSAEEVFYVSPGTGADVARVAASHDAGAAPVHPQRACPGDRALPRADGAEAPLQAASTASTAASSSADAHSTPTRGCRRRRPPSSTTSSPRAPARASTA